mmetsp:Transcript_39169/g.91926  ORF Transcript_39169/g.91926 Transcript_39169/m.91926 type:complete len:325 (-) Transcript_39169:72-1046(-)
MLSVGRPGGPGQWPEGRDSGACALRTRRCCDTVGRQMSRSGSFSACRRAGAPGGCSLHEPVQLRRIKGFVALGVLRHAIAHCLAPLGGQLTDRTPQQRDLVFMAGGAVDQATHGQRHRVVTLGHAIGREAHLGRRGLTGQLAGSLDDAGRVANGGRPGRHRLGDDRAGADAGPCPDREAAQHAGIGADDHARAQGRMALGALGQRGATQSHALVDGAALTDFGHLADDDAHAVVDEDPAADARPRVDLDAGQKAAPVRQPTRQPLVAMVPQPVRAAVEHQRMQAGVARQHLPGGTGCRVAFEDQGDVFAQALEHGVSREIGAPV